MSDEWIPVIESLCMGDKNRAISEVLNLPDVKAAATRLVAEDVQRECANLCSESESSLFRLSTPDELSEFSASDQEQELNRRAPTFLTFLNAAGKNLDQLQKNKLKTDSVVQHGIMSAAGVLLYCRSQNMNSNQMMTALALHQGGASQKTFERLHKRFLCVSYCNMTTLQDNFAADFDKEVIEWAEQMLQDRELQEELKALLQTADAAEAQKRIDEFNKKRHPGYIVLGDNVDIRVSSI